MLMVFKNTHIETEKNRNISIKIANIVSCTKSETLRETKECFSLKY